MEKVRNEMLWTTLWFEQKEIGWARLAAESEEQGKMGHCAYAEKQSAMWKQFKSTSREQFILDQQQ